MNEKIKNKRPSLGWVMVPLIMLLAGGWFVWGFFAPRAVTTSEGLALISGDTVERVVLNEGTQQVNLTLTENYVHQSTGSGDRTADLGKNVYFTYSYVQTKEILDTVADKAPAKGWNAMRPQSGILGGVVQLLISLMILGVAFYFIMRSMSGSRMMGGFTQSRAKEFNQERPDVTFADVAGEDEAVEELEEIREFLASPDKFHKVGARIPRGVLLYGPPGTGKTLLAKAVAGEANAPFFSISGSEFMELYVGVGASRVRELFERAKKNAPAIIFVDEIDAVGRHRGSGIGGGNDEREQTLNQLLVEMDGFDERANIILIAATNRPDILDPALLRPGRFDRQIAVEAPDLKGREAILKVHAQGKPLTEQVDLRQIAKRTPGFTGADLANVLNEAALLTARSDMQFIDERAIDEAIDRVIAGPQKRTRVMNDHDKLVTAYHEGGHALCAAALRYTDPVTKVTILPRGRALGYTMVLPTEDRYSKTRNQILDDLVYAMGGRVAEEIVFRDPSTGASNDIQKASSQARALVTEYGMSDRVGNVRLSADDSDPMTGYGTGRGAERAYSDELASVVDQEVRALLDNATREAWEILTKNRAVLDRLAQRLLEEETLDEAQLAEIFKDVIKQDERPVWNYGAEGAVQGAVMGNPIAMPLSDRAQSESADEPSADPSAPAEVLDDPDGGIAPEENAQ